MFKQQAQLLYQDFDAKINFNGFSIEASSTRVRFSLEILIDELKPGVAEKIQFELYQ